MTIGGSRTQRRVRIGIALIMFHTMHLFGIDYGLTFDGVFGVETGGDTEAIAQQKASLWFITPLLPGVEVAAKGGAIFDRDRTLFLFTDTLRLSGVIEAGNSILIGADLGRIAFSEFSGFVLDHTADGLSLSIRYPGIVTSLAVGYTGLLQIPENEIILSAADDRDQGESEDGPFGPWSAPRLFEHIALTLPQLVGRQTLDVSALFQQDLTAGEDIPVGSGRVHTQHLGVGVRGPILPRLYYSSAYYYGLGQSFGGDIRGHLMAASLSYYIPHWYDTSLAIDTVYASGDDDHFRVYEGNTSGDSRAFIPLSRARLAQIFAPRLTNITAVTMSVSTKVLERFESTLTQNAQIALSNVVFFRNAEAPVPARDVDPEQGGRYLGDEIDLTVNLRPFSDLGVGLSQAVFIPSSIMVEDDVATTTTFFFSFTM